MPLYKKTEFGVSVILRRTIQLATNIYQTFSNRSIVICDITVFTSSLEAVNISFVMNCCM